MEQERFAAVDRYIADLLVPADPALDAALEASAAAGLPPHEVSPNQGKLLILWHAGSAAHILEIGTLGGYSTIWLARALPPAARSSRSRRIRNTPRSPAPTSPAPAWPPWSNCARAGARDVPQLAAEGRGPFDLIFIDADKPSNPEYLRRALELSRAAA